MPIFQDPDRQRFYDRWSDDSHLIRSHDQDQNHHGAARWAPYTERSNGNPPLERGHPFTDQRNLSNSNLSALRAADREGLIRYIKTADTAAWTQDRSFDDTSAGHYSSMSDTATEMRGKSVADNAPAKPFCPNDQELASPAEIERPRSALHSGDFREGTPQRQSQKQSAQPQLPENDGGSNFLPLSSSPTTPWFATPVFSAPLRSQTESVRIPNENTPPATRSRAPSLGSFSSSYVLKTPTSPLVHQANNTDLDFSTRPDYVDQVEQLEKASRRRTLPPEAFMHLPASPTSHRGQHLQPGHSSGNWNTGESYKPSHHPRRSLTSAYSLQLASSVQSPFPRARRPSMSSDVSTKPHAPMVGSYEESILRGRMSMSPSKPLDFTAQIGVLGKGKCKSNLKCPPHVTVPFPAVFYSYPTSGRGRSISDDNPSPYVGLIDLDNHLPKDTSSSSRRRKRHASPANVLDGNDPETASIRRSTDQDTLRKREKRHRRAESPRSPPGGCYRIPQQGQLQIIIKNPNKTAVKLFLIPYDLGDMEPGTKTFIRQRSYSAGPIIDMPLSARKNYGTDRPEASLNTSEDPNDKPVLRYLIHLNICCPSRGRFYLHSSVRVVFANRVPDGKERLRNEIQHPDPRYTPYKPVKEATSKSMMERGPHRQPPGMDQVTSLYPHHHLLASMRERRSNVSAHSGENKSLSENPSKPPHQSHPFRPIPSLREEVSPLSHPSSPEPSHREDPGAYNKLHKGDVGYGGNPFSPSRSSAGPEAGESLLAKRLRGLDVQRHDYTYMN